MGIRDKNTQPLTPDKARVTTLVEEALQLQDDQY